MTHPGGTHGWGRRDEGRKVLSLGWVSPLRVRGGEVAVEESPPGWARQCSARWEVGVGFIWGPAGSASCPDLHLLSLQSSWDLPSA